MICGTIFLLMYLWTQTSFYASTLMAGLFSVYQFYSLFKYIEKTNHFLARFLRSIKYNDFSQSFSSELKGTAFEELNTAFSEVIGEFQRARKEREEHYRYLQTVVQHVGVGLIAFKRNGEVDLINNTAKKLLKINRLKNIDQLKDLHEELALKMLEIRRGEKFQVKIHYENEMVQLSIRAIDFVMRQQTITLLSMQNIQRELEEKEMEAWHTLIRTLTHEIANSIAPISSLASTAKDLLTGIGDNKPMDLDDETVSDVINAVQTIEKRSVGLLSFIENYRKLTKLPIPEFQLFTVSELCGRVAKLMKEQIDKYQIDFKVSVSPEELEITADLILIEQVLINLLKNAVEAVENIEKPVIELIARADEHGYPFMQVVDNGIGIQLDTIEKIFVPFFTTKKEGSGIGLSLSKQILRLHGGSLNVTSEPMIRTTFILRF